MYVEIDGNDIDYDDVDQVESVRLVHNEDQDQLAWTCEDCQQQVDDVDDAAEVGALDDLGCSEDCEACEGTGCEACCEAANNPDNPLNTCPMDATCACERCDDGRIPTHSWVETKLTWLNSADIRISHNADEVHVMLSVGDPRGAFVMTVRRDGLTGELYLHVPFEGMSLPHMQLTRISEGTYKIS